MSIAPPPMQGLAVNTHGVVVGWHEGVVDAPALAPEAPIGIACVAVELDAELSVAVTCDVRRTTCAADLVKDVVGRLGLTDAAGSALDPAELYLWQPDFGHGSPPGFTRLICGDCPLSTASGSGLNAFRLVRLSADPSAGNIASGRCKILAGHFASPGAPDSETEDESAEAGPRRRLRRKTAYYVDRPGSPGAAQ